MLRKELISDQVYYLYNQENYRGKRTHEGLVANDRFYPCVKAGNCFIFGISVGDRFLPGIIWMGHFIPGVISQRGFMPGIFTDGGFQPGVINGGCFMPGIVKDSYLVPGVSQGNNFIPGCYTTDRKFAPGRLWDSSFECGVIDGENFRHTGVKQLGAKAIQGLFTERSGIQRRYHNAQMGGIPIYGTIIGIMDDRPWYIPKGLVTNKGAILGGLRMHNDQLIDKHILTVDFEAILEQIGLKKDGPLDSLGEKGQKVLDEVQEWMDHVMGKVITGGSGSYHSSTPDFGDAMGKAFEELGQGTSELIDNINKASQDYWNSAADHYKGSGGWVAGNDGSEGSCGESKNDWSAANSAAVGAVIGGGLGVSAGLGTVSDLTAMSTADISLVANAGQAGAFAGGFLGLLVYLVYDGIKHGKETPVEGATGSGGSPPPGSKAPDEEGHGSNSTVIGGWGGMKPIEIKNPNDPQAYKFVNTEEGKVLVVNRDELKKALRRTSKGTNFGLNMLTGATIWRYVHQPTPEEIQNNKLRNMFLKMFHDPIWHN